MKTLIQFLFVMFFAVQSYAAASVRLYFIDPFTGSKDTNVFYITPIGTNVLSNGGVVSKGIPRKVTPSADGNATNALAVGHYSVTNRSLGSGIVIRVPDTSTFYDYTNLLVSGYNIFVTIENGDASGTPNALTNNDTRSLVFVGPVRITNGFGVVEGSITALNGEFIGNGESITNLPYLALSDSARASITNAAGVYTDTNAVWVAKTGSDSTGVVGKKDLPFLTLSNAVYALSNSLGNAQGGGMIYLSPGFYEALLVNLQRPGRDGLSIYGPNAWVVGSSANVLETHGPVIRVGNNSRVICLGSNNVNATVKQAIVGYDATKTYGGQTHVPTNVYIQMTALGNSDVAYFYDTGGGVPSVWLDRCDFQSKWDAIFISVNDFESSTRITSSKVWVKQPDGYSFPGGGSGAGRARAVLVSEGMLSLENSSIGVVAGNACTNEVTALTFLGALYAWTNENSNIFVDGPAAVVPKNIIDGGASVSLTSPGGIRIYRAIIAQSGASAPTATLLENTLGFTPTFGRSSAGVYTVNSSARFTSAKTVVRFGLSSSPANSIGNFEIATTSQIILRVVDDSTIGSTADDIIGSGTILEIMIYP